MNLRVIAPKTPPFQVLQVDEKPGAISSDSGIQQSSDSGTYTA
jgi:hypothetical protein